FGEGSLTKSMYPRIAKEWKRGTKLEDAKTVFEGKADDMMVSAFRDPTKGFEREFVMRRPSFWTNEMFLRKDGKLIKIEKPDDAQASPHRDLILIQLHSDWAVPQKDPTTFVKRVYPAGALLVANFDDFVKGERKMEVLFEPTERTSLAG